MKAACYFARHAVERFRQRFRPTLGPGVVLDELRDLSHRASRLRERTEHGDEQWAAVTNAGEQVIFVIKRDDPRGPMCVTVLPIEASPASRSQRAVVTDPWSDDDEVA